MHSNVVNIAITALCTKRMLSIALNHIYNSDVFDNSKAL